MRARAVLGAASVCAFLFLSPAKGQHRVDPRNMYERVVAAVPWTGEGTLADPRRPLYAPAQSELNPASRAGILGYQCVESDDKQLALCEFVAADRHALLPILSDRNIKAFLKGKDKMDDVVKEFKKLKKDFDVTKFAVVMP